MFVNLRFAWRNPPVLNGKAADSGFSCANFILYYRAVVEKIYHQDENYAVTDALTKPLVPGGVIPPEIIE